MKLVTFGAEIEIKPITPAGPIDTARTRKIPMKTLAIPEAIIAQIKGYFSFKFTPKIAGSVMPNSAEILAEDAKLFSFSFLLFTKTASVAAPCAILAIAAIGKIKEPPVLATSANSVVSIAGKL